jgi:uncharacterized protein YfaP (DUF2135 family)
MKQKPSIMKNFLFILCCLFNVGWVYSQEAPVIQLNDSTKIQLSKLQVKTEIVNGIAMTTYDMFFYNETERVLEGSLVFPLGQGQQVTAFAMEVNGALRQAVVVEKVLGQRAFENTVRQAIDPGLLEKTAGNNYKASIYPILPRAYKRVVISYEEVLTGDAKADHYTLPLHLSKMYQELVLDISVSGNAGRPVFKNNAKTNYVFTKAAAGYEFQWKQKDAHIDQAFSITIPKTAQEKELLTFEEYFLLNLSITPEKKLQNKPSHITVLWDASLSVQDRDIQKELGLLSYYLSYVSSVTVDVIIFSNAIRDERSFEIKKGKTSELLSFLEGVFYDGGTSMAVLDTLKLRTDEVLLFSDGLSNLGDWEYKKRAPLFVINTLLKADHDYLDGVAGSSGGSYINLQNSTNVEALAALKFESFRFLGIGKSTGVSDVFPKKPQTITNDFMITGKFANTEAGLVLHFGYGNTVTKKVPLRIKPNEGKSLVKRIWAQEKLKALKDKTEIVTHAKQNQLLTKYTSLIILDRVEDYVQYKIEPPAELQAEYKELLAEARASEKEAELQLENRKKQLLTYYQDLLEWYALDFKVVEKPKNVIGQRPGQTACVRLDATNIPSAQGVNFSTSLDQAAATIRGQISEAGDVLPGVNVFVEGTTIGTQTDFDGNYSINASAGQFLVFNYVGFKSVKVEVGAGTSIDVTMEADETLEAVVVTSQGMARESRALGYAVTEVLEDEDVLDVEVAEELDARSKKSNVAGAVSNLKAWDPETPYLKLLEKESTLEAAYLKYLGLRKTYKNTPSFYMDVAIFFKVKGAPQKAVRIATNLLEMDLENYVIMRALGYTLEGLGEDALAAFVYEEVLELRPEEPQSHRDLALVYQRIGKREEAGTLLQKIIDGELLVFDASNRFKGIESIAYLEKAGIDAEHGLHAKALDLRVVIDWNHNDADIDLWVTDPLGEKAYYSHPRTKTGGRMSDDMTEGYGPESFIIKNALPGTYTIQAKYFANHQQKISGPTILKTTVFQAFGTKGQTREIIVRKLDKAQDVLEIGTIQVD